jgi:putative transcriptional regulator
MARIIHHPDDATLLSYASGSLPSVLSAVIAAHVDMCPHCRRELKLMEQMGLALFDQLPDGDAVAMPRVWDVAQAEPGRTAAVIDGERGVPAPLRKLVGERMDEIEWKRMGFGVWHCPLPHAGDGVLSLLKIEPGRKIPEHGHGGAELTLMLDGAYDDHLGRFQRGDIADLDGDTEHRPIADPITGCICLIASERRASFKSFVSRALQPWTGM